MMNKPGRGSAWNKLFRLQTTHHTKDGAVTADTNCCANCIETTSPSNGDPIYRFGGKSAIRARWMAGAVHHKIG